MSRAIELHPDADPATLAWMLRFRANLLGRRNAFDEAATDVLRAFVVDGDPNRLRQAIRTLAKGFTPERLETVAAALSLPTAHLSIAREIRAEALDPLGGGALEVLADHLRELVCYCRSHGAEPVILSYPFVSAELRPVQKAVAEEVNCRFVDLAPHFEKLLIGRPRSDYFVPDNHCNDAGYAVVAELVEAALRAGT
ncbi:MAG: hypothetical protein EXS13_12770 [Planctomycetes bacterium]|nr:hypothetical protein [Planctomycetota bacterium]